MTLDMQIEALLFYKASPLNKITLMKQLECTEDDFHEAIDVIRNRQANSGLRLLETEAEIQMVTAPEVSDFLTSTQKQENKSDIGKAGAETLAIILYREPISRAEIDQIRGVNSSFILRHLMVRGLIQSKIRKGSHLYSITTELLQHLGVEQKYDLPRFAEFMNAIEAFEHAQHEQ
jgi:segregation and condensation protein B